MGKNPGREDRVGKNRWRKDRRVKDPAPKKMRLTMNFLFSKLKPHF